MGRAPIAQPPGSDTLARPWRAVSGPSTTTEARIVFTRSYGASTLFTLLVSTSVTPPGLLVTSAPRSASSLSIVRTSPSAGTFRYTERPLASSDEARMGSAAVLAPETRTSPVSRAPPLTTMFCTGRLVPQRGERLTRRRLRRARPCRRARRTGHRPRASCGNLPCCRSCNDDGRPAARGARPGSACGSSPSRAAAGRTSRRCSRPASPPRRRASRRTPCWQRPASRRIWTWLSGPWTRSSCRPLRAGRLGGGAGESRPRGRPPVRDDRRGSKLTHSVRSSQAEGVLRGHRIAVVVPAFNEADKISRTVRSIPGFVDHVIVVDDGSADGTARVAARSGRRGLEVVVHPRNRGVGAAIASGYRRELALGAAATAEMAGAAQMDPADLPNLLAPELAGSADDAEGNRFAWPGCWREMPLGRILGNVTLSWLTRLATGYRLFDSQCGYPVASRAALAAIDPDAMFARYGYTNDLMGRLARAGARAVDVPVRAVHRPH